MTLLIATTVTATVEKTSPVFNAYDGVQLHYGVGSESDFLRLGNSGELGNEIEICEDQVVDLWFYVHNSTAASQNHDDLTGPGVATNTVVTVNVDDNKVAHSHSVIGSIDSDQTNPITDDVVITCADKDIQVSYKAVSNFKSPAPASKTFGNFTIKGDIDQGATIGYTANNNEGVVPGCWDYRARINIQISVTVVEEEPEEIPEEEPEEVPEITITGPNDSALLLVILTTATLIGATSIHYSLASRRN